MSAIYNNKQPAYNPNFAPSAPPMEDNPPPYSEVDPQAQNMLGAVIRNETSWVPYAKVPQDSAISRFIGSFFSNEKSKKEVEAIYYRHAGQLCFAEEKQEDIEPYLHKSDAAFQQFLEKVPSHDRFANFLFDKSLELVPNDPKTLFEYGKLCFYFDRHTDAIDNFTKAYKFSNKLPGSSYRINQFAATCLAARAAIYERTNQPHKAIFDYKKAKTIGSDENGYFTKSLDRSFEALRIKPNKSKSEVLACIEYDPKNPDYQVDLAQCYFNEERYNDAIDQAYKAAKMALKDKPSTLMKVYELFGKIAYEFNM